VNNRWSDVSVLLVDDDSIDRAAVIRAFRQSEIDNPIIEATNGIEALQILRGDDTEKLSSPFLILLDLSMPRMDGFEFLAELREDPELNTALVFVLTTSRDVLDRVKAYKKNVAAYIVKAEFASEFWRVVAMIDNFWRIVEFP